LFASVFRRHHAVRIVRIFFDRVEANSAHCIV
jgi:hypothetical protein